MNLLTHHLELPSRRFVQERARTEARLGCRIVKFFTDEPRQPGPTRAEIDALIDENCRLRAALAAEMAREEQP